MTKDVCAHKIITACHHAQRAGTDIRGVHGLMTWTGMTHAQVWRGLNALRDAATKYGTDLVSYSDHVYRVGDTDACVAWLVSRMKSVTTSVRRIEEMSTALANATGNPHDQIASRQAVRVVADADQLVSDLLVAQANR